MRLLKRASSLALAVLLAAPGAPAFAQEIVKAVPAVDPAGSGSAAAGASALSPLLAAPSLPAGAPLASLTPSPWNPAAPTVLLAAPAPKLAPAVGAASMPPLAPAIGAASMPPLAPVVGAASMPPVAGVETRAPPAKAAATPAAVEAAAASDSEVLRSAAGIAEGLKQDKTDDGELPPPSDAVDSLKDASLEIDPNRAHHPSPEDWRDETLYSVVVDRFNKGEGAMPLGDPKSGVSRHGGNLRGLIEKLDYIKESGVTAILVSPLTMSIPEAYHGYAPVHFLAVDPRFGTMADFKELVAKAHKLGIRVGLDWVINHSGPVFEYADGKTQWTGDGKPGPVRWIRKIKPVELTEDDFTRERVITNWDDPTQATRGDFPPNYRHLATDRPATQDKLIKIAQWWMKETDVDFFRLDAVRHVAPGFLPRFSKEIRAYAAKLGKKNFMILGENSTGIDRELQPYFVDGSLDTLDNYPGYRRENAALHGAAPARVLEDSHFISQANLQEHADNLTRFIDLHDTYRFLLSDTPGGLLHTALAYVMTSVGIPLVYYGTEQAFRQLHGRLTPEGGDLPADPQNREDMFASGEYKSASSAGDKFDPNSSTYKFLRALADLRRAFPALTRGAQFPRWSDTTGPGIYAFSRIHEGQEVLVVLNTSGEARSAEMWVDGRVTPAGAILEDALNPGYAVSAHASGGGSKVSVDIPAYGTRVLVRPAPAQ
jgi:glycosidase